MRLRLLKDTKEVFPPYDALLLLSPEAAHKPGLREALAPLIDAIDEPSMQEANRAVDVDGQGMSRAAAKLHKKLRPVQGRR